MNWKYYEQINVLCDSLHSMGLPPARPLPDEHLENGWGSTMWPRWLRGLDYGSGSITKTARKALENKDNATLVRMLQGMRNLWSAFLEPLHAAISRTIDEGIDRDLMKQLPSRKPTASMEPEWPEILPELELDSMESEIEDFVFEKYTIGEQVICRLITPSVVSHHRTCWHISNADTDISRLRSVSKLDLPERKLPKLDLFCLRSLLQTWQGINWHTTVLTMSHACMAPAGKKTKRGLMHDFN
jgi:hypothetical protein